MNGYYLIPIHLFIFFVLLIFMSKSMEKGGWIEKRYNLKMTTVIDDYEVNTTNYYIFFFLEGGIWFFLFVLPLLIFDNMFLSLSIPAVFFLYISFIMYKRKDVFNDKPFDEINEFYGEDMIWDGARRIRYVDILNSFYIVPFMLIFSISMFEIRPLNLIQLFREFVLFLPGFLVTTLLLYPDKMNAYLLKVHKCDIRSYKGLDWAHIYYIYLPVVFFIIDCALVFYYLNQYL